RDFRRHLLNAPAHFAIHHFGQRTARIPIKEAGGIFLADKGGAGEAHAEADTVGALDPNGFIIMAGAPIGSALAVIDAHPLAGDRRAVHLDQAHDWNPPAIVSHSALLGPPVSDLHAFGRHLALLQIFFALKLRLLRAVA